MEQELAGGSDDGEGADNSEESDASDVASGVAEPVGAGMDPDGGAPGIDSDPPVESTTDEPLDGIVLGRIEVSAGDLHRDHTIVSFPFPYGDVANLMLDGGQGDHLPLQVNDADGTATFILPALAAGEVAEFTIVEVAEAPPPGAAAVMDGDHLAVRVGDKQLFRWTLVEDNLRDALPRDARAGYIYPLYTPAGLNVTDDYPVDHPSHHGIWSAWMRTTFRDHAVDFLNGYSEEGHVDLESMGDVWSGPVSAGFVAFLAHTDITTDPTVVALNEQWTVTAYKTHDGEAPYFVFDIHSTQETATDDPIVIEQFHLGGFNFRGADAWQSVGNAAVLTSEGHDRESGDGQIARWCAQFGMVGDQRGGYAALGHPDNLRHPQGLRIHPNNPFFSFLPATPLVGGRFTIEVGEPYVTRFRVVSYDGDADAALLDRLWDDYADPPEVVVVQ